jgi:hypothetical protein
MPVSFPKAADRHLNDARHLISLGQAERIPNATQLFGISAECALKAVLVGTGCIATSAATGDITNRNDRKHVAQLWADFPAYMTGRASAHYSALLLTAPKPNPFDSFNVSQRYDDELSLPWPDFHDYEVGSYIANDVLRQARLNGDVP